MYSLPWSGSAKWVKIHGKIEIRHNVYMLVPAYTIQEGEYGSPSYILHINQTISSRQFISHISSEQKT